MTDRSYADFIAAARSGKATFSQAEVHAVLMPLVWPNGQDGLQPGEWLDRDDAFKQLADIPFGIANIVSDNEMETAIDAAYQPQSQAFVMYVHGINRYAFDAVHAEEEAGQTGDRTNPERLRGGPKIAYAILKDAGAEPALTTDPTEDPGGLGGTRLYVPIALSNAVAA